MPPPDLAPLIAVSLFTGAGGLDHGFAAAGVRTALAIEYDEQCARTLAHNGGFDVINRPIEDVPDGEILERLGGTDVDIVIGGPPCQPFSKASYWVNGEAKGLLDPRADTIKHYFRVVRLLRPRAFVLENVAGLGNKQSSPAYQLIETIVEGINADCGTSYVIRPHKLNALDYGVPQRRERMILCASIDGAQLRGIPRTHQPIHEIGLGGAEHIYTSAWDALHDVAVDSADPALALKGKWAELVPSIPEGQNYLYHTERGDGVPLFGWRRRFWNFLLKLSKREPSWTITAQPGPAIGPFHWESRRLHACELAALQTFPRDFEILGTLVEQQRQLGNAVPSAMAEQIARTLRAKWFGDDGLDLTLAPSLAPAHAANTPPPEPLADVPRKYFALAGSDTAHPGTGKGRGAVQTA